MGMEATRIPQLVDFVDRLVATGEVSAAAVAVADEQRTSYATAGWQQPEWAGKGNRASPVSRRTEFDLASLTKPFTATAALLLEQRGEMKLETRLGDLLPDLPRVVSDQPLQALLRHRAGLIPWFPFYCDGTTDIEPERFADGGLWGPVPGDEEDGMYSDLGPILWSLLARRAGYSVLDVLRGTIEPLPTYAPDPTSTAGTHLSNQREVELAERLGIEVPESSKTLLGKPQDGNARLIAMPGHAGLFGGLASVLSLGREWLAPSHMSLDSVDSALSTSGRHALGWWRGREELEGLGREAFGHNGFTGCSLWLSPIRNRVMVMLAHRTSLSDTLAQARREFHRLAITLKI